LLPFSLLYGLIIFFRNLFYDKNIFKPKKFDVPIISIGNLTTGGTGKTPLTLFVAEYFLSQNKKVGIAARGYKKDSGSTSIVYDGIKLSPPEESGDEMYMIATELMQKNHKNFFITAGSSKIDAINEILKFKPDVIILDDAFQSRYIHRNLDILIIDAEDYFNGNFSYKFLLPSGNLREPFSNYKRADLIIQNNKSTGARKKIIDDSVNINYKVDGFYDLDDKKIQAHEKNIIAFCGIAQPDAFLNSLEKTGVNVFDFYKYEDHKKYHINELLDLFRKFDVGTPYVTTQKDAVKLKKYAQELKNFRIYYLKIDLEIADNGELFYNKLNSVFK
jgi:tetraacyldisaccharide 4'-kinase